MMKYIRTKDENNLIIDMSNNLLPYHITENGYIDFNRFGMFEIVKQADNIEELIQDDDLALFFELKVYCDDYYYEYTIKNVFMSVRDAKQITGGDEPYGHFKIKDIKELYIKDKHDNYIKVAERKDEKGELELL